MLTFEETQLISNFFEESNEIHNKYEMIERIKNTLENTEDPQLLNIANSTISKLHAMDEKTAENILKVMPVDPDFTISDNPL